MKQFNETEKDLREHKHGIAEEIGIAIRRVFVSCICGAVEYDEYGCERK